jgi:pimeloyl-ACP methyl ester carboxylesterase
MFHHQIEDFRHSARVIAPDLRGHGQSDKPDHGYRISTLARDLKAVLDRLEIETAAMVGWSMGASVLWSFSDLFGTGRISKLVLIDEPACVVQLPGMSVEAIADAGAIFDLAGLQGLMAGLLGPDSDEVRRAFVNGMVSPDADADMRQWLIEQNLLMPARHAAALLLNHATLDWRDVIPRLAVPTLVIGGDVSHVNPASQRWIASQISGARLEVLTAAQRGSHFPFLENPVHFNQLLRGFLKL